MVSLTEPLDKNVSVWHIHPVVFMARHGSVQPERPTSEVRQMHKCPQTNCKFQTQVSARMQHHIDQTGHRGSSGKRKEFRGHLSQKKTKKK